MAGSLLSLLAVLALTHRVLAERVLSSFVYTRYGDRTPFVLTTSPTLTPLGAQQMYEAGDRLRQRYLLPDTETSNDPSGITGINSFQIEYDQLTILSTDDQYVFASALAFMQGMYQPLVTSSNYTYLPGESTVANGSNIVAPLNGYQYPNINSVSSNDLNSIWLEGMSNCPAYLAASNVYYESEAFQTIQNSTTQFYQSLQPGILDGIFSTSSVGYYDAYYIYDYLRYAVEHNTTIANLVAPEDLLKAKILADDWVFAMNADLTSSAVPSIKAISGQTLATRILQAFYTAINTEGASDKLTLLFGSFEPMVAFAGLSGLTSPQNAAFYNVPEEASSFIFEMVSMQAAGDFSYPPTSDIFVRFLYQNGTGADASLVAYPLFGLSPSQTLITLTDFISGLENFMLNTIEDWCTTCDSFSIFCPAFTGTESSFKGNSSSGHHLSPVIAGVIGAAATLAVALLLFALLMLLGGVRFHRVQRGHKSDLAGFKGGKKLQSDQDLVLPKGGAVAIDAPVRGHERVGSWEMKNSAKEIEGGGLDARTRPSFDDDMPINPFAPPMAPHDRV
jgi:hypothetical protein